MGLQQEEEEHVAETEVLEKRMGQKRAHGHKKLELARVHISELEERGEEQGQRSMNEVQLLDCSE